MTCQLFLYSTKQCSGSIDVDFYKFTGNTDGYVNQTDQL